MVVVVFIEGKKEIGYEEKKNTKIGHPDFL